MKESVCEKLFPILTCINQSTCLALAMMADEAGKLNIFRYSTLDFTMGIYQTN